MGFAVCQWLTVVVLAKLASPAMVGQYALALGITVPIMLLSNLNLRAVQSTDVIEEHPFSHYVQLRFGTTVLALVACLIAAAVASSSHTTFLVIGFVALAKASESMSDVFYGRWQKWERMDRIAKSMLARGIGSLLALASVVRLTGSVAWGILAIFIVWLAVLLAYDARPHLREGFVALRYGITRAWHRDSWQALRPLAWVALPLGIVQMLISLNANVPRILVEGFSGEHELGIFAAIAYVTVAGSTIVTAVGQAVSPRLARTFASGDRAGFVRMLRYLLLLFSAGCALALAVVLVAGRVIVAMLYTSEYAAHAALLPIFTLCFGAGAVVSVFGFGITAARQFRSQVPLVLLATTVATVSGIVLIPRLGIEGAAWAVLLSLVVWSVASGIVLRTILATMPQPLPDPGLTSVPMGVSST